MWLALLLLSPLAAPSLRAAEQRPIVVLNYDPPRVELFDSETAMHIASVSVAEHPTKILRSKRGDFLYVLHDGHGCRDDVWLQRLLFHTPGLERKPWKKPSSLSVVDLRAQHVLASIGLSWNISDISLSEDGRFVVATGNGVNRRSNRAQSEMAAVHVIDTESNELVSRTVTGLYQSATIITKSGRIVSLAANAFGGPDWNYVMYPFSLPCGRDEIPKLDKFSLTITDPARTEAVATIPLPGKPSLLEPSDDERWLYVLDFGKPDRNPSKNIPATVAVIDVAGASLKQTFPVGEIAEFGRDNQSGGIYVRGYRSPRDHASSLYTFENGALTQTLPLGSDALTVWRGLDAAPTLLITRSAACPMDPQGALQQPCVDLHEMEISKGVAGNLRLEVKYFPRQGSLIFRSGKHGDQILISDLQQGGRARRLELGSEGARTRRLAGNSAGGVAFGILDVLSGGGLGNKVPATDSPWSDVPIVANSDGTWAYMTNTYTNELTALDMVTGAARSFPLDAPAKEVSISPDGKWLAAFSRKKVIVIDAATQAALLESNPPGDIVTIHWSLDSSRLSVLSDHAFAMWQMDPVRQMGQFREFPKTIQLLH